MPSGVASQTHFGYADTAWVAARSEMRNILVETARQGRTIAYSDLVTRVRTIRLSPQEPALAAMLGEISADENRAGRGMLSVLVVHKGGDMRPGPGFFDLARRMGRDVKDLDALWVEEFRRVVEYWQR